MRYCKLWHYTMTMEVNIIFPCYDEQLDDMYADIERILKKAQVFIYFIPCLSYGSYEYTFISISYAIKRWLEDKTKHSFP